MEYDKIKVYVPKRVAEILQKDVENFEFFKKDEITPNKNAFITVLIVNYLAEFRQRQENLRESVESVLRENTTMHEAKVQDLSAVIMSKFNKEIASEADNNKFDSLVSFKPTKETQPLIDYIDEYLLSDCSLSEYFRNMFVSYTALPQDMREKIIFKTQYELITDAIKNRKKVFITIRSGKMEKMEISPYLLSRAKEEMHVYLLYAKFGKCASIKLSRVQSVTILGGEAHFDELQKQLFDKMQKYGVQFFYNFDEKEVKVRLTKKGQKLYRKIYVHRPIPDEVDGDVYTFRCSYTQILQYFARFGGEVEFISPQEINQIMYNFHNSFIIKNNSNDNIYLDDFAKNLQ